MRLIRGGTRVTYYPGGFGCSGQMGTFDGFCDSGRELQGNWEADSCTRGSGTVRDDNSKKYKFIFGLSKDEVVEKINKLREQLSCSKLLVDGKIINTEVNGKIIPVNSFDFEEEYWGEELESIEKAPSK